MTAAATLLALIIGVPFGYFSIEIHVTASPTKAGWRRVRRTTVLLYPLFLVIFGATRP